MEILLYFVCAQITIIIGGSGLACVHVCMVMRLGRGKLKCREKACIYKTLLRNYAMYIALFLCSLSYYPDFDHFPKRKKHYHMGDAFAK